MLTFKIIIISITILLSIISIYLIARFIWFSASLNRLYTLLASEIINTMALFWVAEKWKAIQMLNCPSYEEFIRDCSEGITYTLFHPFCWNRYRLLPDLNTALLLKQHYDSGVITDSEKEYTLRAEAFRLQLKEL